MLLCCSKMAVVSDYFFFFLHLLVAVIFIFAENAAVDSSVYMIHYSFQFRWTYFTLHANFMLCMNMASVVDKSIECLCIYGVIFLLSHYGITSRLRFLLLVLQDPDVYNGGPFLLQSFILTEGTSMTSLHQVSFWCMICQYVLQWICAMSGLVIFFFSFHVRNLRTQASQLLLL